MSTGKDLHDFLLEKQPPGVVHEDCEFCASASLKEGEPVTEKIFDQAQHEALLEAAVTAAVSDSRAEAEAEILRLTTELDETKTALAASEKKVQELEAANAERERQAELAALADVRAEQVSEITPFTEEQLEAKKASWAEMSEDDFAATLASYQEIVEAAKAAADEDGSGEDGTTTPTTRFDGTRASAGKDVDEMGAVKRFFARDLTPAK